MRLGIRLFGKLRKLTFEKVPTTLSGAEIRVRLCPSCKEKPDKAFTVNVPFKLAVPAEKTLPEFAVDSTFI